MQPGQKVSIKRWIVKCKVCNKVWHTDTHSNDSWGIQMQAHVPVCQNPVKMQAWLDNYKSGYGIARFEREGVPLDAPQVKRHVDDMYRQMGMRLLLIQQVVGVYNPEIKCGAKCRSAKGATCECSCAGQNHGSNL